MTPGPQRLAAAMEATWPPAERLSSGPFTLRRGLGGGQRVSAATVAGSFAAADIDRAIADMRALGQAPIFQIRPDGSAADAALDAALDARGWQIHDAVSLYLSPVADLAAEPPARMASFTVWPPLAIQRDIWTEGGIGPARQAVMERVGDPRTAILGRVADRAAGAAFVAVSDGIAMLHALHVTESSRRQGAAGQIMRAAGRWAQAQGAGWLGLAVTRANRAANALYASLGMAVVARYHYRIEGGQDG